MRTYETLIILDAIAEESEHDKVITKIEETITAANGVVDSTDKWGKRRLAYEIDKKREGYYVLVNFKADPAVVTELDELYHFSTTVIRGLTTLAIPKKIKIKKKQ